MNKAPRRPPIIPSTIEHGMSNMRLISSLEIAVNFREEPSATERGAPVSRACKIESVNTAIDVEKNTRHNIENVQKVLGLDIS